MLLCEVPGSDHHRCGQCGLESSRDANCANLERVQLCDAGVRRARVVGFDEAGSRSVPQ